MFYIGLVAGILGLAASSFSITVKSTTPDYYIIPSPSFLYEIGELSLLFSIIGLIGVALMKKYPKIAGLLMIVAGIGGFIFMTFTYIISTILFFIVALICLFSKKKEYKTGSWDFKDLKETN